ncbi:hypothetical protein [Herbaspirillum huttiense]|uniref:hypothetical protein n=1 Tax=Herbaspirillum huttiense TaxID=863372 RepID=UPI002176F003|nr:hypothetical protein [Herbaspirillum huttiense]UWE16613.1 hypothetical protein NY669_00105 [Herbaspirillum huttiense]
MTDPTKPVDRETLYEEVWSEPVTLVAPRYGLSDVGLAKICRKLGIPLPSRGYWAKIKAGRIMSRAALPKLKGSPPPMVAPKKLSPERIAAQQASKKAAKEAKEKVAEIVTSVESELPQSLSHPLVLAAKKRLSQKSGWGESGVRSAPKEVLNLSVTEGTLERALLLTEALFAAIGKLGFDARIDSTNDRTLLESKEHRVSLEFALKESVKRSIHEVTAAEEMARQRYALKVRTQPNLRSLHVSYYDYTPTGILTLEVGRWPSKTWKDTPRTSLEERIPDLAAGIVLIAQRTHQHEQELRERQVEQQRAREKYELIKKRREAEATRLKEVEAQANSWERAEKLRAFSDAFEKRAMQSGELTPEQLDWLAWVRAKADGLDPLTPISDPVLNAPELNKYQYW